jgi:diguanylate cyclase (GGDEF)-like protein
LPLQDTALRGTVSIGVATWPDHGHAAEGLLQLADAALYAAKTGGRNQVYTADGKNQMPVAAAPGQQLASMPRQ